MGVWFPWLPPVLIAAQLASGSVTGVVRDAESGSPVAGAIVTLVDLDRTVVTDSEGRYELPEVPAGPQHVAVRRMGYAPRTFHALVPREGALEIDVALSRDPIQLETIEVEARVPIRGLEGGEGAAYPDRGLTLAAVRHHPLLSEPDVLQAAGGGEVALRPEAPSGLHVRGGASDQIAYLLDGFPILNPYYAGGSFSAWNPDALSRMDLFTSSSITPFPDALSGVVSGTTRVPGPQFQSQGSLSSTQARATIEGPIGRTRAGYLLGLRSAFPGLLVHRHEGSYLRGEGGDWLGKVESPLLGGSLRLLGYGTDTEIDAAAEASADNSAPAADPTRNRLTWASRSFGVGWTRELAGASMVVRIWRAAGEASANWRGPDSLQEHLSADRRDEGASAVIEWTGEAGRTEAGIRGERSRTTYHLRSDSTGARGVDLAARTPVSAAFLRHERPFARRGDVDLSLVGALAEDEVRLSPGAEVRWKAGGATTLSGSYLRRHQFAQSLRNPESVIATIFPVDLYVGAGAAGVPIARSDLGVLAVEHHPAPGIRLGAQGYLRGLDGLVLVAPQDGDPFATTGFVTGSGSARGFAIEAAANGARYALVASYGFQRVRLEYADTTYVPEHGAAHSVDAGVIVFPSATSSVRLGITSLLGRRATATMGALEWEACNLLDQGCEFSGSPGERSEPLGATRLPAYLRVDLGVRKHWHVKAAGRDWLLAVFASATNLLGRKNVLTVVVDPSTGRRTQIEMRPRSPLVVGIDWQF